MKIEFVIHEAEAPKWIRKNPVEGELESVGTWSSTKPDKARHWKHPSLELFTVASPYAELSKWPSHE